MKEENKKRFPFIFTYEKGNKTPRIYIEDEEIIKSYSGIILNAYNEVNKMLVGYFGAFDVFSNKNTDFFNLIVNNNKYLILIEEHILKINKLENIKSDSFKEDFREIYIDLLKYLMFIRSAIPKNNSNRIPNLKIDTKEKLKNILINNYEEKLNQEEKQKEKTYNFTNFDTIKKILIKTIDALFEDDKLKPNEKDLSEIFRQNNIPNINSKEQLSIYWNQYLPPLISYLFMEGDMRHQNIKLVTGVINNFVRDYFYFNRVELGNLNEPKREQEIRNEVRKELLKVFTSFKLIISYTAPGSYLQLVQNYFKLNDEITKEKYELIKKYHKKNSKEIKNQEEKVQNIENSLLGNTQKIQEVVEQIKDTYWKLINSKLALIENSATRQNTKWNYEQKMNNTPLIRIEDYFEKINKKSTKVDYLSVSFENKEEFMKNFFQYFSFIFMYDKLINLENNENLKDKANSKITKKFSDFKVWLEWQNDLSQFIYNDKDLMHELVKQLYLEDNSDELRKELNKLRQSLQHFGYLKQNAYKELFKTLGAYKEPLTNETINIEFVNKMMQHKEFAFKKANKSNDSKMKNASEVMSDEKNFKIDDKNKISFYQKIFKKSKSELENFLISELNKLEKNQTPYFQKKIKSDFFDKQSLINKTQDDLAQDYDANNDMLKKFKYWIANFYDNLSKNKTFIIHQYNSIDNLNPSIPRKIIPSSENDLNLIMLRSISLLIETLENTLEDYYFGNDRKRNDDLQAHLELSFFHKLSSNLFNYKYNQNADKKWSVNYYMDSHGKIYKKVPTKISEEEIKNFKNEDEYQNYSLLIQYTSKYLESIQKDSKLNIHELTNRIIKDFITFYLYLVKLIPSNLKNDADENNNNVNNINQLIPYWLKIDDSKIFANFDYLKLSSRFEVIYYSQFPKYYEYLSYGTHKVYDSSFDELIRVLSLNGKKSTNNAILLRLQEPKKTIFESYKPFNDKTINKLKEREFKIPSVPHSFDQKEEEIIRKLYTRELNNKNNDIKKQNNKIPNQIYISQNVKYLSIPMSMINILNKLEKSQKNYQIRELVNEKIISIWGQKTFDKFKNSSLKWSEDYFEVLLQIKTLINKKSLNLEKLFEDNLEISNYSDNKKRFSKTIYGMIQIYSNLNNKINDEENKLREKENSNPHEIVQETQIKSLKKAINNKKNQIQNIYYLEKSGAEIYSWRYRDFSGKPENHEYCKPHNLEEEPTRRSEIEDYNTAIKSNSRTEEASIEKECPICKSELILKKSKRTGKQFIGCSKFPKCGYYEKYIAQNNK